MGKSEENFGQEARRYTARMLWITTTLNNHYNFDGTSASMDAASCLSISLEALDDNTSARKIARQLARSRPAGSAAQADLTSWWIQNLFQDNSLPPLGRLSELAEAVSAGNANMGAYYQAELGSCLTDTDTSSEAVNFSLRQIELDSILGPLSQATLSVHAPRLASISSASTIYSLLRKTAQSDMPEAYAAFRKKLDDTDPLLLRRWHDEQRHLKESETLQQDIASAYQTQLNRLVQTNPTLAWEELQSLQVRWQEGRTAILLPGQAPVAAIFSNLARTNPREASYIEAARILENNSTPACRSALVKAQGNVADLQPSDQLHYLGELHARLQFKPDLVTPSRDHLLKIYHAHPEAGIRDILYDLVPGDDVLRRILKPPEPAALPAHKPGLITRTLKAVHRKLRALSL